MALWNEVIEEILIKGLFSRVGAGLRGIIDIERHHFARKSEILYYLGSGGQRERSMEAEDRTVSVVAAEERFPAGGVTSRREIVIVNQQAGQERARGTTKPQFPPVLWNLAGASCWPDPTEHPNIPGIEVDNGRKRIWRRKQKTIISVFSFFLLNISILFFA